MFTQTIQHLLSGNLIQRFATRSAASLKELPSGFTAGRDQFDGFLRFLAEQPADKRSPLIADLMRTIERARRERWPQTSILTLETARKTLERDLEQALRREQSQILMLIDLEMRTRFGTATERDRRLLPVTPTVKAALDVLSSIRHRQFLTGELPSNH
jgi:hypothetical protein